MDKTQIIESISSLKPVLSNRYGIERIGLFGSFAKDDQGKESDIDLVFHLLPGRKFRLKDRLEFEKHLSSQLGNRNIELINYKYMNPVIKSRLEKHVIYV